MGQPEIDRLTRQPPKTKSLEAQGDRAPSSNPASPPGSNLALPGPELQPSSPDLGWACRPSHPLWFSADRRRGSPAFSQTQMPQHLSDYSAPSSLPVAPPFPFLTGNKAGLGPFAPPTGGGRKPGSIGTGD